MEVPRLLVDAGLVAFSTAAIFVLRKIYHKCTELQTNIERLNETVKDSYSDEKENSLTYPVLSERLERIADTVIDQHELQLEEKDRQEDIQRAICALTNKVKENQQDINEALQKTQKNQEDLNNYFLILDNELTSKIEQIDDTLTKIFTRWEHQLEPFMGTSDKDHHNLQEDFVKIKESFQELADNVCRELSQCNQRLASMSEAIAEHRDHYARDRRQFIPNQHRPYGRDTRSQRGLLRQAAYESRCGSHGHEVRPQRRDCGPVRQEPSKRPLIDAL